VAPFCPAGIWPALKSRLSKAPFLTLPDVTALLARSTRLTSPFLISVLRTVFAA
jgi:hypothetical protein